MTRGLQLAEAILSDDGELDFEDASSILLDDTRSRLAPGRAGDGVDHERQFLVGNDDDDEQEQEQEVAAIGEDKGYAPAESAPEA